ncbi:hypothetical protein ES708_10603 [subsurface metagenome]
MKNYKPFNLTPRNIRNHARKTSPIPIIPHTSAELNVPKAKVGSTLVYSNNNSLNTNNPPDNTRNEKTTVHFVGGVQAIYYHLIY